MAHKRSKIVLVGTVVSLVLTSFGVWGLTRNYGATHNPDVRIESKTVTRTTDKPEETPPGKVCESYKVAADEPRFIDLPSIGASGCVQKVGIDQNKAVAAPDNVHLAGWYIHSERPGDKGLSLLDGHVQGRQTAGIFKNLKKLKASDSIRIQMGDDSWREFKVVDNKSYPVEGAGKEMFKLADGVDRQLTLITCGGEFDKNSQTYKERVIVRAKAFTP